MHITELLKSKRNLKIDNVDVHRLNVIEEERRPELQGPAGGMTESALWVRSHPHIKLQPGDTKGLPSHAFPAS